MSSIPSIAGLQFLEEPRATWDKRYKQRHYAYRDCHRVATTVFPLGPVDPTYLAAIAALSPTVYYAFGTNAQAINAANWPANCYGRFIMVQCTQDAWIRFISLNPAYIRRLIQEWSIAQLASETPPVLPTIFEAEQFIPAGAIITFYPTLALSIIFRADAAAGVLTVWIEGNVEGTD